MTKTAQTFYKKVGRRYQPVYEYDPDLVDGLPQGHFLLSVSPGSKGMRRIVEPAYAPMIAAGKYASERIAKEIVAAGQARPQPQQPVLTEQQQLAWGALNAAFNNNLTMLQYPSAHEIAEAGVAEMITVANELLDHPSVKQAYEHFLLMCKLAVRAQERE